MDTRLEVREIWKHMNRYHNQIGETILYYQFDAENSQYDRVYDEGYRRYLPAVRIPLLWVDQQEATEDYTPEGRRPTVRLRLSVSARDMHEAGLSVTEVHGNRLQDDADRTSVARTGCTTSSTTTVGTSRVSAFQIRGRVKGEYVVVGITAIETFPDDDMAFDYTPGEVITP